MNKEKKINGNIRLTMTENEWINFDSWCEKLWNGNRAGFLAWMIREHTNILAKGEQNETLWD